MRKRSDNIAQPDPAELWRVIPSAPGYEASSLGRIRRAVAGPNTCAGYVLATSIDRGYHYLSTSHGGKVRRRAVHHLVAEAFHGPRPAGMVVRHLNGNQADNSAANVGYSTQRQNILDKLLHGTMPVGERHHAVRMTDQEMLAALRDARLIGQKPAARKHGVSQSVLWRILNGKGRAYLLEQL